jgi:molecular chaperone Hsp33
MSEAVSGDTLIRAMTDDGAFRVIVVDATTAARSAVRAQSVTGATAQRFAELLAGAVLVRETMAPGLRVQLLLKGGRGSGSLVADSFPDGAVRGLARVSAGHAALDLGDGALLQAMRTLPNGTLHSGIVDVPRAGGISAALMQYMQDSEQVVSMVAVGAITDGVHVRAAAGYLVQLLPEVTEPPLAIMTERLRDFEDLAPLLEGGAVAADTLLRELLYGMPFTRLEERALRFRCHCSELRVVASLATLSKAEIQSLVDEGGVLEIGCDYCGKQYRVSPEALRGLLARS